MQLNSKSELTIQEQQMKYSAVCNMLAAVYAKQVTRQLGGSEALVCGGLDLVDFAPLSLVPVAMCQHGLHRHY